MIELPRFLPDQKHIDAVIDSDGEDEAKGKDVEQVERDLEQLHQRDHRADGKGKRGHLNQPEPPVAIEHCEQRDVEDRHQRADQDELAMRPRHQIREGKTPT